MEMSKSNIYHKEIKILFLDDIKNENSKKAFFTLFNQISEFENLHDKDIYDMNIAELRECLETLSKTTIISAASTVSKLVTYWKWAINPGKFTNNVTTLSWLTSKKVEDLIPNIALENTFISEEEMYEIVEKECKNKMDGALILLIYRGVYGYRMSELRYLETDNINFENNNIKIVGDKKNDKKIISNIRNITLSDKDMEILKEASLQSSYSIKDPDDDSYTIKNLVSSKYLFKYIESGRTASYINKPITSYELTMRIKRVFESHFKPQIRAMNIITSAMVNDVMILEKEKGKLIPEDYKGILAKYNKNPSPINANSLRNTYELFKNKGILNE